MARLQFKLLGTPEVYHHGQLLAFPTRKALALLIYLAVERGSHSREKLMALFWPESDSAHGRAALRRTLVHVRRTLQDAINSGEPEMPHLLIEHGSLGFNFASDFDLDLRPVEAAYALAHISGRPQAQGSLLQEIDQLQAAVNLSRGGFLEGFSLSDAPDFDSWASIQREVWSRRLDLLFDRLAHMQFEAGALTHAIEAVTRWLTLNPLNEKAYRLLMRLHFAAGNREAALQAFETCRAILARELHVKPSPQTQALVEHVRTKPPPRSKIPRHVAEPTRLEAPFVGREADFTQLARVYHTISRGRSQVVIVEGEAGIGKTRLASEFLAWAAAQGADILQGRAFEAGGRLPYQPLVEALRSRLERVNAPDDLLSDAWLVELSRLLPEIRERYPDLPFPSTEEGTAKTRLFEAMVRLFQALAERVPLVLFLDDIQWADSATLDVLSYAIRRWRESNTALLLLLNLRTEGVTPVLLDWVAGLAHDLHLTRLPLTPLSPEHLLRMVHGLVQKQQDDDENMRLAVERFGRWLFAETGGQPFFIVETLNALLERGMALPRNGSGGAGGIEITDAMRDETSLRSFLPAGVREVISVRLARFTHTALELLVAGAVLGQRFTFEWVCLVTGLSESDVLSALDEVLRGHLLHEAEAPDEVVYRFAHDKIRDVVYAQAGDARRRLFHRRALELLSSEREAAKNHLSLASHAELARHALASGQREAAFRLSVAAGDDAMELFAVRDAITYYEQAWRLVERLDEHETIVDLAPSDLSHLSMRLGRAYELTNEFEKARTVYRAMLGFARQAGVSTMEGTALNRLATLTMLENFALNEAESLLQQALPIAEQSGDPLLLAETEWSLAQVGYYSSNGRMSLAHGQRALELARKLDRQELSARCLNVIAYANELLGRWEEAEASASEARLLYRALKDRAMEVDCLGQIAKVRICDGRAQGGMSAAQEALAISAEIENAWGQAYSTFHLAMGSLELGRYADALSFAQQCLALARAHNLTMFMSISLTMMGRAHRAMLDLNAAHMVLQEALALNEVQKTPWLEMISEELCAVSVLAERWTDAYTYALQAMNSRHNALYLYVGLTHWYRTGALLHTNDIERALEDVRLFGEEIGGSRRHRIPYLRSLVVLAQNHGEIDMALEHLQEAATLTEEAGLPGERWSIEVALGDLYLAQANEHLACQAYARAAEIVRSLAEKIENEDQRTTFLSTQPVQQILQRADQN